MRISPSSLILATLLALPVAARAAEPPAPVPATQPPVNVLVLTHGMKVDAKLQEQFLQENVRLVTRKLSDPLSAQMLRSFHVAVIADWEGPTTTFVPRRFVEESLTTRRNNELLQEYIKAGGGFFFTPIYGSQMSADSLTRYLEPFGAGVQSAQVRDDAHAYSNLKPEKQEEYFDYAWTTAITPHPATAGVERLFYPTSELRWDDLYSTPVLTVHDPAWTVLVKGMETSVAAKGFDYYTWRPVTHEPPVLAAVRNWGDGRIALFAPSHHYTFAQPFAKPDRGWILEAHTGRIDGILLDKGDGTNPSHGRKLMLGLFRWLAESARAKGLGGYEEKAFAALEVPKPVPAPEWIYSWKANDGNQWFKLLVGGHSAFSDGTGTIAEFATAAKAAGVSMLFMTETFARFDPAKWPEFRDACAKASDDTLKVVPGLDVSDIAGNRYLLLGSPVFPGASLLTADGKALAKPQYLCLCFPKGITVQHRATTTPVPHELHKHFQGVSIFTYRNGELEDNSFPAYQWQIHRFSNPLPFAVHETFSPAAVAQEAAAGHQLYGAAPTLTDLAWYLGEHGTSHFWESPVHLQVSAGPLITTLGGSVPDPNEPSVKGAIGFSLRSDEPIKEVSLWENFNLYRRWTPNSKEFTANNVKMPEGHANWVLLTATDAKGRMTVAPGMAFGRQVTHTWRCGDRQNWWSFPNIYTGTDLSQIELRVPTYGTAEGSRLFPDMHGPQRGDNLAARLDFNFAGPAVYIQDVTIDQRYFQALFDDAAYDAKPANAAISSRVYTAKIRYHLYWPEKVQGKTDFLPFRKELSVTLRQPVEPTGDVFPIFTTLDIKHAQVRGDMSYSYCDATSGQEVTGILSKGFLDLPKGGHVGGFIALSDGIRVSANGTVGFAPPAWNNGALPAGTTWQAAFVTVPPAEADLWLKLMGLRGTPPFAFSVTQGKLTDLAYAATCTADKYGMAGSIDQALDPKVLAGLTMGLVNLDKEGEGKALVEYRLPLTVAGVNYNWPAALLRDGAWVEEVSVFEGQAYARVDVTKPGAFYVGNTILADAPNLRIGLLRWTADTCEVELNNPSTADIATAVWTAPEVKANFQGRAQVTVKAGTSLTVALKRETNP